MSAMRSATRWSVGLTLALSVHAAGAYALLAHWDNEAEPIAGGPVILVDFAAAPAAPVSPAPAVPPAPEATPASLQPQAAAQPAPEAPVEKVEVKQKPEKPAEKPLEVKAQPAPVPPDVVLPPPKPVPKRVERKPPQRQASLAGAPSHLDRVAPRTVAPAPGASAHNPDALPNWRSALVAQIERHKRYPEAARAHGDHGVAQVAFSVDRHGGIHGARVVRSSGSAVLDRDALAWLARSQPLPAPPPEISGALISVVVPLRYTIQ